MSLEFLGLILWLVVSWWIGWRLYWHFWLRQRPQKELCTHCGNLYVDLGDRTYCPHCGQLVVRWSNRR